MFGEYLVEKKVITESQLVDSILIQNQMSPSIVQVVREKKWMTDDRVLKCLNYAIQENFSFEGAARHLDFWPTNHEQEINEVIKSARDPIGQILHKNFNIDLTVILSHLDDYIHTCSPQTSNAEPVEDANSQTLDAEKELDAPPTVEKSSDGPQFEFQEINTDMLGEFIENLSEELKSDLELNILSWEDIQFDNRESVAKLEESLRSFYREFHSIKGSARFIGSVVIEGTVHVAEDLLTLAMNNLRKLELSDIQNLSAVQLRVVDVIWGAKYELARESTDHQFYLRNKTEVASLFDDIEQMNQSFTQKVGELDIEEIANEF